MKVNGSSPGGVDALHLISEVQSRPVSTAKATTSEHPVVDVSLKTQALLSIDQTGPIDDDGLIAEIRQRIAEGRFGMDYARIAEAMTAAGHRVN